MKNGAHILSKEIENPEVDRRTRDDWRRAPTFKLGRYYISVSCDDGLFQVSDGRWSIILGPGNVEPFTEFLDALEPDDSLEGFLLLLKCENYMNATEVLLRLVRSKVVSEGNVRLAALAQIEEDEG